MENKKIIELIKEKKTNYLKQYNLFTLKKIILKSLDYCSFEEIQKESGIEHYVLRDWFKLKQLCLHFFLMNEVNFNLDLLVYKISRLSPYVKKELLES